MAARLVFGSDDNCQTANWKRPTVANLVPGAADTVLTTNTAGTVVEWDKVQPVNLVPGPANTVMSTTGAGVVGWNSDIAINHLNITGILRFDGVGGQANQIPYSTLAGGTDVKWTTFPIMYASQLGAPYRVGTTDTGTTADIHHGRTGHIVSLRFAERTITVPDVGTIQVALAAGTGGNYQSTQPVTAVVNGATQLIAFQQDSGGGSVRYYKDLEGGSFAIGDVVTIRNHTWNSHAAIS